MIEYSVVQVVRAGATAEVVLNRPERKNAIIGPLVSELRAAFAELATDESVHAVILRGAGGAFCSGLDIKEFNAEPRPSWTAAFQPDWRALHHPSQVQAVRR